MPFSQCSAPRFILIFVFIFISAEIDSSFCFGVDSPPQPSPREQAWAVLQDGLKEEKALKRVDAVKALSLLQGERRAARSALGALRDKNAGVRSAAAATLGQLHVTSAIPQLRESLSDKNVSVVLSAAHSLLLLKDKSAYGIYYAILMGDRKTSAGMIQEQLDRLKDPKQVAELGFQEGIGFVPFGGMGYGAYRAMAKKDSSPIRAAAARFLALDRDPVSEDALIQTALADKSGIVQQAALEALAQRGDPGCIGRLMKNLDDDRDAIRYWSAATILHLSDLPTRPASKDK